MKKTIVSTLLLVFLLGVAPVSTLASHDKESVNKKTGERLFYAFPNEKGLSSLKKNYKNIDIYAPQVYTVGFDLKIKDQTKEEKKMLKEAKRKRLDVMPLIVQDQFNQTLMSTLLLNPVAQEEIIDFMVKEAKRNKFIGWQFDFENLNHRDRYLYVAFVRKTYEALKKEGLLFSVAVSVRGDHYNPHSSYQDWSSGYDYEKLAEHSDFLSLMTYDDPNSLGPVASLLYVRHVLRYMTTQVPPEKMSLGIPLYCWKWTGGIRTRSTTYDISIEELDEGTNGKKGYDAIFGNEWISWKNIQNGQDYISWCDGVKGAEEKMKLINEYKLRGFSAWAIGQENKGFWKVVK